MRVMGRVGTPPPMCGVIETNQLRLRSYREDDLSDLVRLVGNWEVARWVTSVPHPYSEARGREWIASVREEHAAGQPRRFAIALRDTDCLIGGVGLHGNPGEPALGYWLGQPYWGNQYAREAVAAVINYGFQTLGISTICASTDPGNAASQRVLLHCGLEHVGEIQLSTPTRQGAVRGPLFRVSRAD
jgi:RimJ/RimL family protein N-acetyltransferase